MQSLACWYAISVYLECSHILDLHLRSILGQTKESMFLSVPNLLQYILQSQDAAS